MTIFTLKIGEWRHRHTLGGTEVIRRIANFRAGHVDQCLEWGQSIIGRVEIENCGATRRIAERKTTKAYDRNLRKPLI